MFGHNYLTGIVKYLVFYRRLSRSGQSVLEIVVALGVFVVLIASLAGLAIGSLAAQERGSRFTQARALAAEGWEAVRAISDRDWSELKYNRSAVAVSGGRWIFSGEGTVEQIGDFTRVIDFAPVFRNSDGDIVSQGDPAAARDASSTKVTIGISWEIKPGVNKLMEWTTYLTDWKS